MGSGTSAMCSTRDAACAVAQCFHSCSIVPPHSLARLSCINAYSLTRRALPLASGHEQSTSKETLMKVLITMLSLVILLSAYPALAQWPHGGQGLRGPGAE